MLKIYQPCDFHVHLREGDLSKNVLIENNKYFQKILIMPNLSTPITNSDLLKKYRSQILKNNKKTEILFTIYLNQKCNINDLKKAKEENLFFAAKLYPLNATTNSQSGVSDVKKMAKYFDFLEKNNIPLCIHGEHIHNNDDPYEREKIFLDKELSWIVKKFANLKITLEHITTKDSVEFVKSNTNTAASITVHHLLENSYTFLGNYLKPELFCKPIIKNRDHQISLQKAALSGNSKFFFGSDSAPHLLSKKFSESCCAGVYSTKYAVSNIIQFFYSNRKLSQLDNFLSLNGCKHYNLNHNQSKVTYKKLKGHRFQKLTKFKDDFLINYNHFKEFWIKA